MDVRGICQYVRAHAQQSQLCIPWYVYEDTSVRWCERQKVRSLSSNHLSYLFFSQHAKKTKHTNFAEY